MAFSTLTNSSELTVMRSGGISIYRLVAPVLLAALALSLLMERFNAYWRTLAPDLQPTAGYYTDAQRFLAAIAPLLTREDVPRERFVRAR